MDTRADYLTYTVGKGLSVYLLNNVIIWTVVFINKRFSDRINAYRYQPVVLAFHCWASSRNERTVISTWPQCAMATNMINIINCFEDVRRIPHDTFLHRKHHDQLNFAHKFRKIQRREPEFENTYQQSLILYNQLQVDATKTLENKIAARCKR